jgi:hypothetical protein
MRAEASSGVYVRSSSPNGLPIEDALEGRIGPLVERGLSGNDVLMGS